MNQCCGQWGKVTSIDSGSLREGARRTGGKVRMRKMERKGRKIETQRHKS